MIPRLPNRGNPYNAVTISRELHEALCHYLNDHNDVEYISGGPTLNKAGRLLVRLFEEAGDYPTPSVAETLAHEKGAAK